MAGARERVAWGHTSAIMALIANVNRDPKKRSQPYAPRDFNPYAAPEKPKPAVRGGVAMIRQMFLGDERKN